MNGLNTELFAARRSHQSGATGVSSSLAGGADSPRARNDEAGAAAPRPSSALQSFFCCPPLVGSSASPACGAENGKLGSISRSSSSTSAAAVAFPRCLGVEHEELVSTRQTLAAAAAAAAVVTLTCCPPDTFLLDSGRRRWRCACCAALPQFEADRARGRRPTDDASAGTDDDAGFVPSPIRPCEGLRRYFRNGSGRSALKIPSCSTLTAPPLLIKVLLWLLYRRGAFRWRDGVGVGLAGEVHLLVCCDDVGAPRWCRRRGNGSPSPWWPTFLRVRVRTSSIGAEEVVASTLVLLLPGHREVGCWTDLVLLVLLLVDTATTALLSSSTCRIGGDDIISFLCSVGLRPAAAATAPRQLRAP